MTKLVSALRINVGKKQKVIHNALGYRGSLETIRKNVTALIAHERIELKERNGVIVRQYTEKLISDAILNGDKHQPTMEMAKWWLDNVSASLKILCSL